MHAWAVQSQWSRRRRKRRWRNGGGDAQLPFAINGNAKAHAHTRTQAQWVLHMPWQRIYRMLWGKHFATHMKSFWQTSISVSVSISLSISVSLYAAFPINFHLQRACKFPSFSATLLLICANWQSERRDANICIERVLLSLSLFPQQALIIYGDIFHSTFN